MHPADHTFDARTDSSLPLRKDVQEMFAKH